MFLILDFEVAVRGLVGNAGEAMVVDWPQLRALEVIGWMFVLLGFVFIPLENVTCDV
jgi:hypothetical protein